MCDILDLHLKHCVKVKVKKVENEAGHTTTTRECFTIDPQTTNYHNFRYRLAKILRIDGEFSVFFEREEGQWLSLQSDWDLDGAIAEASRPHLSLLVQPIDDQTLSDWDIICPCDIPLMKLESPSRKNSWTASIINQMVIKFQHAFGVYGGPEGPLLSSPGNLSGRELHLAVFRAGGIEASARPQIWPHLLNVFPASLRSQDEREAYLGAKCEEYYQLRNRWQQLMRAGNVPEVVEGITSMVHKDVQRTDRTEKFFSGSDDSDNVRALYNILTTYALNHPHVSYCQGMGDLLSPILYVMRVESLAYVCFCGLMRRAADNFRSDGRTIRTRFRHLQRMIKYYDSELYESLREKDALDLLFCYRWLLLELKREFPFSDMLRLTEVLWASMPPRPPRRTLDLYQVKFPTSAAEEGWAERVRRDSIAHDADGEIRLPLHYRKRKYRSYIAGKLNRLRAESCKIPRRKNATHYQPDICQSWACGEVFEEKPQVRDALYEARDFLRNQWCYSNTVNEIQLNNWLNGRRDEDILRQRHASSDSNYGTISDVEEEQSDGYPSSKEDSCDTEFDSDDDSLECSETQALPPPHSLGGGHPFLLFCCLSLLRSRRAEILRLKPDLNELGVHLDKLVRKHRIADILPEARRLFTSYLDMGWDV